MDVVALGELLIDFTPGGLSANGNELFERNPGGAPANVLVALTRLGGRGGFIGKVGEDQFGIFLKEVLTENHIDTSGLIFSKEANTTLAFVHLDKDGDRSFSFYRKPGADTLLKEEEINLNLIDSTKIFHFGSLSMTHEPARTATLSAIAYAKKKNKLISYDPNWRPPLWESDEAAKEGMSLGLPHCDILKLSEEEMEFLTGESDLERGTGILMDMGISLIFVTLGPEGCFYRYSGGTGCVEGYKAKAVDTTGAGDAFFGTCLYYLSQDPIQDIERERLEEIIRFANGAGALCVQKRGAIDAIPTMDEIEKFLAHGENKN